MNRQLRSLLVEDDVELAEMICTHLQEQGFSVDHATDGLTALCHLHDKDYDLLLTDIGLKDIQGDKIFQWVQRHSPGTFCLLISASMEKIDTTLKATERNTQNTNFNSLLKPFSLKELNQTLVCFEEDFLKMA